MAGLSKMCWRSSNFDFIFSFSRVIPWNLLFVLSCLEFGCFRKILLGRVARLFLSGVLCIVLLNIVFYSLHPRIVTSLNMYSVHTILQPRRSGYHDLITCHQAWGLQIIKHRHQAIMTSDVYIASLNWWSSQSHRVNYNSSGPDATCQFSVRWSAWLGQ